MDVHPPLAKLLLTLAGYLAGFDGEFDFKDIGKDYLEPGVPYVAMRLLPAIMGVMTVPMIFLTLKASGCRTMTATLGAGMIIFGMTGQRPQFSDANDIFRERITHSIPPYPPGLTTDRFHCPYCSGMDLLHQPARTGAFQSFRSQLVVLACCYWSGARRYREREMGWTVHNCLGRQPDRCTTLGSNWGCTNRYSSKSRAQLFSNHLKNRTKSSAEIVVQTLPCPCLLSDCHPNKLLCGAIRSPFSVPC